jgi:hypothetical protein
VKVACKVTWGIQVGSVGLQLFGLMLLSNISDFISVAPGVNPDDHGIFLVTGGIGGLPMSAGCCAIVSLGMVFGASVVWLPTFRYTKSTRNGSHALGKPALPLLFTTATLKT